MAIVQRGDNIYIIIYIFVYFDHFKIKYIITLRDQRIVDGMRDLSYFTACQSFLPLALAFGLKLPIAVGRIINRIHLTLLDAGVWRLSREHSGMAHAISVQRNEGKCQKRNFPPSSYYR